MNAGNFYSNNYIEYETNGDRNKTLSIKECFDEIKPYLKDIINNLKKSDTWKIQLTITTNFISYKDTDEGRVMHSNNVDIEIMIYDKVDKAIKDIFERRLSSYQIELETSMKGSDFVFDCVHLLYYKCYKINLNNGGSHIDSLDWVKKQKSNYKSCQR